MVYTIIYLLILIDIRTQGMMIYNASPKPEDRQASCLLQGPPRALTVFLSSLDHHVDIYNFHGIQPYAISQSVSFRVTRGVVQAPGHVVRKLEVVSSRL